jgi:hypothetical protein
MKMLFPEKKHFVDNVHAAIVLRIEDELLVARAKEILAAVEGAVENDTTVVDDCRPLWLHFDSVSDTELKFPTGYAPNSRKWIDGLVKSIAAEVG